MAPNRYPGAIWLPSPAFYTDRFLTPSIITGHTTEGHERTGSARSSAEWCARKGSQGTAHLFCDGKEIYQSVEFNRQAWHCNGGNAYSIGVEFAGRADQKLDQWTDEFSLGVLRQAGEVYRWLADTFAIPLVLLTAEDLKTFKAAKGKPPRGCCAHRDWVRAGFGGQHHDWGDGFPAETFLLGARMMPSLPTS